MDEERQHKNQVDRKKKKKGDKKQWYKTTNNHPMVLNMSCYE